VATRRRDDWAAPSAAFPYQHGCRPEFTLQTSLVDSDAIWFASDNLYVSRNGGESWSTLYPSQFMPQAETAADGTSIFRLVDNFLVDPRSAGRAFAVGRIWTSNTVWELPFGYGEDFNATDPRVASSSDGGATWRYLDVPEEPGVEPLCPDSAPIDGTRRDGAGSDGSDLSRRFRW
jgi:hypothetical protein